MTQKGKLKTILLAEDDPDDIFLITEAVHECGLGVRLEVVHDGEELLDYLFRRGNYGSGAPGASPNLILLDLNMPLKDGYEALVEIKSDANLCKIPVIVLTTSSAEEDLDRAYRSGASGFITKPASFRELRETVHKIGAYWLDTVTLPNACDPGAAEVG